MITLFLAEKVSGAYKAASDTTEGWWTSNRRLMSILHHAMHWAGAILFYRFLEHEHDAIMWSFEWVKDALSDLGGFAGLAALIAVFVRKRKGKDK